MPTVCLLANDVSITVKSELTINTKPGTIFQVEKASNLTNWEDAGTPVIGSGETLSMSYPFDGSAVQFRLTEIPVTDLASELETLRLQTSLPGLAAAVLQDNEITGFGATGIRRAETTVPVAFDDKWHIGSLTKSMTATLAAILVEDGVIDWDTTVSEVFTERSSEMASGWSDVTLEQLLANSGGAPGDLSTNGIWTRLWDYKGGRRDARLLLLDEVTALPLRYTPGQGYEYSNAGFAIAGAMLEEITDTPWEKLMTEKLFKPLGMTRSGFGPPATPRQIDNPVGHSGTVSALTIWDSGESADNPTAIGPAGTVHASIVDLARYVRFHLKKGEGEANPLLSPESFEVLHTKKFGNEYALGWSTLDRSWAGGTAITHTGSNTQWYAVIWIAPEVDWACVVCTNFGGTDAFTKLDTVVGYLLGNYAP